MFKHTQTICFYSNFPKYNTPPQVLFTFCNKTDSQKSRNTPDTPDSLLENKMFHYNLCVFIIISALLYLILYRYINHWCIIGMFHYNLCVFIIISVLLYLVLYRYINHWCIIGIFHYNLCVFNIISVLLYLVLYRYINHCIVNVVRT